MLQTATLKRSQSCNVFDLEREWGKYVFYVIDEVHAWVEQGAMEWVDDQVSYKLATSPLQEREVKKEA
jgi:hypothetical protein